MIRNIRGPVDYIDSVWQISIISLVTGGLIGALAYRLLTPSAKRVVEIESELNQAREELTDYKDSVNQHFNKTSDLVNDLTQNYVKVYQHLAEGAQTLGDSRTLTNLLEQHQGRVSIAVSEEQGIRNVASEVIGDVPEPVEILETPEVKVDQSV